MPGNNMEGPCSPLTKEGTIHGSKKIVGLEKPSHLTGSQAICRSVLLSLVLNRLHGAWKSFTLRLYLQHYSVFD